MKEYDKSILEFYLTGYLRWRLENYPEMSFVDHAPYLESFLCGMASGYNVPESGSIAICFKDGEVYVELMFEEE